MCSESSEGALEVNSEYTAHQLAVPALYRMVKTHSAGHTKYVHICVCRTSWDRDTEVHLFLLSFYTILVKCPQDTTLIFLMQIIVGIRICL